MARGILVVQNGCVIGFSSWTTGFVPLKKSQAKREAPDRDAFEERNDNDNIAICVKSANTSGHK